MIGSTFDNEKAIAAILYISTKVPDIRFHKFFKILYFANLKHIAKYGRPVVNDKIIAMKDGPVFSKTYDILKGTPGAFSVSFFKHIKPEAEPDLDQFSDSDIECLNESIHENKDLSFTALVQKSHDQAWEKTKRNGEISFDDMIEVSGAPKEMKEYVLESLNYGSYRPA